MEDETPVLQWGWRGSLGLFFVREAEVWLIRVTNQREGKPEGAEDKVLHQVGKRQREGQGRMEMRWRLQP